MRIRSATEIDRQRCHIPFLGNLNQLELVLVKDELRVITFHFLDVGIVCSLPRSIDVTRTVGVKYKDVSGERVMRLLRGWIEPKEAAR